jgi:endonuclease/exonuclease/phosphatase family metal-dependent hydrolase
MKRTMLLGLLTGTVVVTACGPSTEATPDPTVSVLTLNIWHDQQDWSARLEAIVTGVREVSPDIICLQEVLQNEELPNQAETLADRLGYEAYFVSWDSAGSAKRYGNAILTRDPVTDSGFRTLEPPDDYRVVAYTRVDPGSGPMDVYCTHLHHTAERPETRERQIESALTFIDETRGTGPTVLAGDFNARVSAPELRALSGRFTDTYGALHPNADSITTLNTAKGHTPRRIDHVFVAPGAGQTLVPVTARLVLDEPVDGVWGTDHFGVLVELQPTPLQ